MSSVTIAPPADLPAVLLRQFPHARQRVLPPRKFLWIPFGQAFRDFAERRLAGHLREDEMIHQAVRIEFGNVGVALFAQTVERQRLAIKGRLVEMGFDLSRLCM